MEPEVPNPAFLLMDREDAFWAAKRVAAFTDAEIRALVETGEYSDARASQWIADSLIRRRDKIAEAWFSGDAANRQVRCGGWDADFRGVAAKRQGVSGNTPSGGQAGTITVMSPNCRMRPADMFQRSVATASTWQQRSVRQTSPCCRSANGVCAPGPKRA